MAVTKSLKFPARVYFFTQTPSVLIDAGYDSIRIERRKDCFSAWAPVLKADGVCELRLAPDVFNYSYTDPTGGDVKSEFRAVLQNSVLPGTPPDVPQPVQKSVNLDFELAMTTQELRDIYLWGQDKSLITDTGQDIPEYVLVHYIKYGIAKVERVLGITLLPRHFLEKHDHLADASLARDEWLTFYLDQFPIIPGSVGLTLKLPGSQPYEYPAEWLRVREADGEVFVVPDGSGVGPVIRTSGSLFGKKMIPDAYEVDYYAGFLQPGIEMPFDLKDAIGKEAAAGPLNIGGDLLLGAGIASSSLSLDGLSQSTNTTSSATNAGYGARLIQYEKELKSLYKILIPYYRGLRMRVA
jgi:hypothetical protein